MKKTYRVYVDTSVFGGCLDEEFAEHSLELIERARQGRVLLLISSVVADELSDAPEEVQSLVTAIPPEFIEESLLSSEVLSLRNAYLSANVVGERWRDDATHVAAATVAGADAILSWNFRHIVHLDKIRGYNEVNRRLGYRPIVILSPMEFIYGDDSKENEDQGV